MSALFRVPFVMFVSRMPFRVTPRTKSALLPRIMTFRPFAWCGRPKKIQLKYVTAVTLKRSHAKLSWLIIFCRNGR